VSVIAVQDLWKRFRIPHERHGAILDMISGGLSIFERRLYTYEEFWALKQISFELANGESLGVIGPNGCGKSTLLKILAGVMKPDRGTVETNGSIAPVLELGIGFHGDLTVKENALIYGVLMGIPRSLIKKRIDSILEFAGLNRFQDAMLKNLSSGMQARLAFSIATQCDAEMFLVDEALAVGDMEFAEKCLDRFRELKKDGKSIVLVSHDMDLIKSFRERAIYLLNGEAQIVGSSEQATDRYINDMKSSTEDDILYSALMGKA
jgi:homopolymeric O-antigen transport system ATP-binding protein